MDEHNDSRWKQRYSNYTSMLKILDNGLKGKETKDFTELEQIGLAKSFELCFELLWKLLKDFLEREEVEIGLLSPKNVIKAAAAAGLLEQMNVNGDVLMRAQKSRDEFVHIYDYEKFAAVLDSVQRCYLPEFRKADHFFMKMVKADE